jgi:exosome complex protein LRP1
MIAESKLSRLDQHRPPSDRYSYRLAIMADEIDPAATLATLRTSLESVEKSLAPLLERKWNETTAGLGTMDRAKMDILVSYAINDLIWGELDKSRSLVEAANGVVYLKMKGVDPATHEVSAELVCPLTRLRDFS